MPNDYFQFKQFLIKQDKCAMKVCTDACLFGAWITAHSTNLVARNLLDIGTGTGLLPLMFAQKNSNAIIDAVEIDKAAAEQAKENFYASKWKERLHVHNNSIQKFSETTSKRYDVIISNPPFYENYLKSNNVKRTIALHSAELNLENLINIADNLLNNEGNFFVLLPYHRTEKFIQLTQENFFVKEKVLIRQTATHSFFRTMFCLTKQNATVHQSEIIIMNERNNYTDEFINLLKGYYLYL